MLRRLIITVLFLGIHSNACVAQGHQHGANAAELHGRDFDLSYKVGTKHTYCTRQVTWANATKKPLIVEFTVSYEVVEKSGEQYTVKRSAQGYIAKNGGMHLKYPIDGTLKTDTVTVVKDKKLIYSGLLELSVSPQTGIKKGYTWTNRYIAHNTRYKQKTAYIGREQISKMDYAIFRVHKSVSNAKTGRSIDKERGKIWFNLTKRRVEKEVFEIEGGSDFGTQPKELRELHLIDENGRNVLP